MEKGINSHTNAQLRKLFGTLIRICPGLAQKRNKNQHRKNICSTGQQLRCETMLAQLDQTGSRVVAALQPEACTEIDYAPHRSDNLLSYYRR